MNILVEAILLLLLCAANGNAESFTLQEYKTIAPPSHADKQNNPTQSIYTLDKSPASRESRSFVDFIAPDKKQGKTNRFCEFFNVKFTDVIVALFTIIIGIYTLKLSNSTKKLWATAVQQAKDNLRAIEATEKAADAAQKSAAALPIIERAYVFVGVDLREGKIFIDLKNHGKTPAILCKICGLIAIQKVPPTEIVEKFSYDVPPGIVIASGEPYSNDITQVTRYRIKDIKGRRYEWGKNKIFCYGRVVYMDVLKNTQTTTFCWEFDRHHRAFKISDSKLNDHT